MYILGITFLVVLNFHRVILHQKCCDAKSSLRQNESFPILYYCDEDEKRVQIVTNETNFLQNATEGTCLDISPNGQDISEYVIKNNRIVEEKPFSVKFYHKCCPLGYFYHSVFRSCILKEELNEYFFTESFVKVGLPHCSLIVDYKLTPDKYIMEQNTLNISDTVNFQEGQFCLDLDERNFLIGRGCHEDLSPCYNGLQCIRKCCPDGQSYVGGKKCRNTYEHGFDLSFTDRVKNSTEPFGIIHGLSCRMYVLGKDKTFNVDANGVFQVFTTKNNSNLRYEIDNPKSYCIEHVQRKKKSSFEFLKCFNDSPVARKFLVTRWAKILSCIFIVFTVAVYAFLPEMLNLFGKLLLSYCSVMLTIFIFLTYAQFNPDTTDNECVFRSLFSSYLSLASFSWLNVMCFDIWWTFGTPKSFVTAKQRKSEIRRFLVYSLYGWGLPFSITLLTFLLYTLFNLPEGVRPIFATFKCFWERRPGNYGMLIYYLTPLILMEFANLVLFCKTLFYCLKVKGEINKMNDTRKSVKEKKKVYNLDKDQLLLILKLSVTMGISFAFEVVSSIFDFRVNVVMETIEIVWDTINCLQGVFIFLIFVCKRRVYQLCRNKILTVNTRKISVSSVPTTTTSQLSEVPLTSKINNRNV